MKQLLVIAFILGLVVYCAETRAQESKANEGNPAFSVEVHGEGRPMILIPGLTCGGNVWDTTVEHYKDDFELHVFTLAGMAGQPPIEPPLTPKYRDAIIEYIKTEKLEQPIVMGHSLGGYLAFWIGATAPELTGPIISVDGGTFFGALMNPAATEESMKPQADMMKQMMGGQNQETFRTNTKMFLGSMVTSKEDLEFIFEEAKNTDPETSATAMYELMTTDLRDDVATIDSPTLLIGSSAMAMSDAMRETIESNYNKQLDNVKDATIVITSTAKHFIMQDDPEFFFSTVDEFLGLSKDAQ